MNKDWTRLYADVDEWAQAHRDEFVADISRVCRIRSVSVMNKQDPEQPFGEACRKMLDEALGQPEIEPLIDGGSYARKIPNAYAYGATVPGRVRLFGFAKGGAHQPDEYCDIPNLLLNIRVFVRALLELDELYAD